MHPKLYRLEKVSFKGDIESLVTNDGRDLHYTDEKGPVTPKVSIGYYGERERSEIVKHVERAVDASSLSLSETERSWGTFVIEWMLHVILYTGSQHKIVVVCPL